VPGLKSWIRRGMEMLLCVALVFATAAQAARTEGDAPPSVPIAQLVARAKEYDGKILTVEGEAIGYLMERGNHAWVNLLETAWAIEFASNESSASPNPGLGEGCNYRGGDPCRMRGIFSLLACSGSRRRFGHARGGQAQICAPREAKTNIGRSLESVGGRRSASVSGGMLGPYMEDA